MLNIGAGNWHCEGWTNLDYPSEWYSQAQKNHEFISYDIRGGKIPFEADTVKAVYTSHVIEHIEDRFIQAFFADVYRVLKSGGVFRIACPDAEFLYQVSKFENHYWDWRKDFPGDHINWWTFGKTKSFLEEAGFKKIIRSKYTGSMSEAMKDSKFFDRTYPEMSLYVEAVK